MRHSGLLTCLALAALPLLAAPAPPEPPETGDYSWVSLPGKGPLLVVDGEVMVVHTGPALSDPDAPKDAKDLKVRKVTIDLWRVTP